MADFRKWLFALAVVALLAGFTASASAHPYAVVPSATIINGPSQTAIALTASGNNSVTPVCSSHVANANYMKRAEDYGEQVGDLVVSCIGGNPIVAEEVVAIGILDVNVVQVQTPDGRTAVHARICLRPIAPGTNPATLAAWISSSRFPNQLKLLSVPTAPTISDQLAHYITRIGAFTPQSEHVRII